MSVGFFDFGAPPEDRRLLVLSYYFPPAGGPGVQRVTKFVKHLPDYGWRPTVLTVEAGAFPQRDASLGDEIPPDVAVHRTPAWDPFALYARLTGRTGTDAVAVGSVAGRGGDRWAERLARWVRANVFLPDARVGWVPFALGAALRLVEDAARAGTPFHAVLTSGPPHSTHLAGWLLKRLTGLPWMADFRDPWTDINYYHELPHTPLARRLDAALERRVLTAASGVVTVSPTWCDLLRAKGAEPVHLVQNGFDLGDFPRFAYASSDTDFVLTHVGSLYASRNPAPLWAVLARLRAAGRLPKLRLRLVGRVDAAVRAALDRHGLTQVTEFVGYVPHEEAIAYMQRASMLLLLVEPFPADRGMITGKAYEYMAAGRPVLGLGPADGDAAALLEGTMAGMMFDRDDTEGAAAFVQGHYASWTHQVTPTGAPPYAMHGYSRQAQTAALADALFLLPDPPPLGPTPPDADSDAPGGASARPPAPRPARSPHPA